MVARPVRRLPTVLSPVGAAYVGSARATAVDVQARLVELGVTDHVLIDLGEFSE